MQAIKIVVIAATGLFTMAADLSAQPNDKSKTKKEEKASARKPEPTIKQYWFVMLSKGSNRTQDSATAAKIQEGHIANINRMYSAGKLKVAGPFGDDGDWRGIFIFDCETKEEVEKLLAADPAVMAGRLAYDIHPWWTAETGSFIPGIPPKN